MAVKISRAWIIAIVVVCIIAIAWLFVYLQSGYKVAGRDKHKNWGYFPNSSNPDVAIDSVKNFYIGNIQRIPGTGNYMVYFGTNRADFYDQHTPYIPHFGIMSSHGRLLVDYDQFGTIYYNDNDIVVLLENPDRVEVYDIKTLKMRKPPLHTFALPARASSYGHSEIDSQYVKQYKTDFYSKLQGLVWFEDKIVGSDNMDRGYSLFKDDKGHYYKLSGDYQQDQILSLLCDNCIKTYQATESDYWTRNTAPNIKIADESNVIKNHFDSGFRLAWGSPTGGGDEGPYANTTQTWLMYYTATLGKTSTSFKAEGGRKDISSLSLYQLDTVKSDKDTILITADDKLWRIYKKK